MQFSMMLQNALYAKQEEAAGRDDFEESHVLDIAIDLADGMLKGQGPEAIERVRNAYLFNMNNHSTTASEVNGWTAALNVLNELEASFK